MSEYKLLQGDSLEVLKDLDDNSIDSVVTDPPYGLSFMGKKWDYDVPQVELWEEVLRVLKPGGHLLSFAGSRTYHRMAVNIEDAGFEIRDMIAWTYGQGFPKSHNIGKAVDKLQGNEREVTGTKRAGIADSPFGSVEESRKHIDETKGNSPWEGWGTALKPAHEPIVVARKPFDTTVAENVLEWGTAGLNIDGSRVPTKPRTTHARGNVRTSTSVDNVGSWGVKVGELGGGATGRFPANFIHDGSDEVVGLFPDSKSTGGSGKASMKTAPNDVYGKYKEGYKSANLGGLGDSGSAARFFYCAKASKSERNKGLDSTAIVSVKYNQWNDTKQTQEEKEVKLLVAMDTSQKRVTGVSGIESKNATEWNTLLFGNKLTEKYPISTKSTTKMATKSTTTSQILNWLTHLLTKEYTAVASYETENGGSHAASVENSNTLITTINEKMVSALGVKNVQSGTQLKISVKDGSNFHSTVKPVDLMRYLVKLVTPPNGTVLDPFNGSGTTGIGCVLEDFNYIGIEREQEYIDISEARIAAWNDELQQESLL